MDYLVQRGGLIITLLFLSLVSGLAQNVDGIAAIVENKVITFSDVKRQVDQTEKLLRDSFPPGKELENKIKEARLNGLRALIERQLIIQDFTKVGYFIPDSIIEDRLREVIKEQFDGDRSAFVRTLLANGVSLENYKEELRNQTIVQAMRQKNVSSAVLISPYQIEKYYQDNVRQFVENEQIRVSLIFMRRSTYTEKRKNADGVEVDVDPNEAAMKDILYQLDTGSDFAKLAKAYSDGPKRDSGGDLGFVGKDTLRPEISSVAFQLKPGQVSRIISTDDGFYIVRLEERKKATIQPISEVREQIEQTLMQEERQRLQQEWLDGLKAKTFVKMF